MKKITYLLREYLPCIAIAVFLNIIFWTWAAYVEQKSCLCAILTYETQVFPIDEKLNRLYAVDNLSPGTYVYMSTQCNHKKQIQLTIDPDSGAYEARLIPINTHEESIGIRWKETSSCPSGE